MKILLTNDDGIEAEGIQLLRDTLSADHDVYIIAPDRERSACSNIFTMRDEVLVTKKGENSFSISGYPADCVSIGIHSDIIPEIDLVISGINHGPNLGDDIHFSGTVAGARTAFIFGKPALAVSIDSFHAASPFLIETGIFIKNFLRTETIPANVYLNINYPNLPADQVKGIKYTKLSKRTYKDRYVQSATNDPDQISMKLYGIIETENLPWNDSFALENSYISITPMSIDSTDYNLLSKFQNQ
ncbi:MAG TPA: 5'/3'-nucleotidase SurE [Spirochaetota bacterium]|nr:5'/3'-nucleotidase SurE [Spirochaetota bacterium]HPS85803.1 5'/3'-nucleotidase SurE [Spirochaetota bacterium]